MPEVMGVGEQLGL